MRREEWGRRRTNFEPTPGVPSLPTITLQRWEGGKEMEERRKKRRERRKRRKKRRTRIGLAPNFSFTFPYTSSQLGQ